DQVLIWLAAAGVAALLVAHPWLFRGVQWIGAAYLVFVGAQLLRRRDDAQTGPLAMQPGRFFRQGVLITLLNPKAIVFYMAFFPLFIDPGAQRGLATFATMAALIAALTLAYCTLLILAGHALRQRVVQN